MKRLPVKLVIGALVTMVVALGVAVFLLATEDRSSVDPAAATAAGGPAKAGCLVDHEPDGEGAQVELDLDSTTLSCAQARDILHSLQRRDAVELDGSYEGNPQREGGWACFGHPLAMYPVLEHCTIPGQSFLVLGTERPGRARGPWPPPLPPPGTEFDCGDRAENGYGTYNVRGHGVDCLAAMHMAYVWEEVCLGTDEAPNPCPVPRGFSCSRNDVGIELVSIACVRGGRAVNFENGA